MSQAPKDPVEEFTRLDKGGMPGELRAHIKPPGTDASAVAGEGVSKQSRVDPTPVFGDTQSSAATSGKISVASEMVKGVAQRNSPLLTQQTGQSGTEGAKQTVHRKLSLGRGLAPPGLTIPSPPMRMRGLSLRLSPTETEMEASSAP